MKTKIFTDNFGKELTIESRKSAITFTNDRNMAFVGFFEFDNFDEVIDYLEDECMTSWKGFTPKLCESFGADYYEYYDSKLDNNGYLTFGDKGFRFERPVKDNKKLYQLNKAKAQSLVYDLRLEHKRGGCSK